MFLLILKPADVRHILPHFNTSHVSINQDEVMGYLCLPYFNTSHVSINPNHPEIVAIVAEFQYISCFY